VRSEKKCFLVVYINLLEKNLSPATKVEKQENPRNNPRFPKKCSFVIDRLTKYIAQMKISKMTLETLKLSR
jgi:hypothetical protein